jgi:hypothetical protein
MKISLKDQTKATIAGIISIAVPMTLLLSYHGTVHFESIAALSVGIAVSGSYYQGAITADRINAETKEYFKEPDGSSFR